MKDSFLHFYNDLKKNREKCPWAKDQSVSNILEYMKSEIKEVEAALKSGDNENLKEELGDVLWDALFIMIIAEETHKISAKQVIEIAREKLIRRKPWVFGKMRIDSKQEAISMWNKIKSEEKKKAAEEYVYLVDENDDIISGVPRSESIKKNLWHRGTGIIVLNSKDEILVHKRTPNAGRFPSCYDMFFGGNVTYGESYEENAKREIEEEAGLKGAKLDFLFKSKFSSEETKTHYKIFRVISDGPFEFQKKEVVEVFFISVEKLKKMFKKEKFCSDSMQAFELYQKGDY